MNILTAEQYLLLPPHHKEQLNAWLRRHGFEPDEVFKIEEKGPHTIIHFYVKPTGRLLLNSQRTEILASKKTIHTQEAFPLAPSFA